ncbi:MAG: SHOCT-like domain-containing protein [Anaerolineales bacterium]
MATSEERLKILQMIQDGKITASEGAKLLEALNRGAEKAGKAFAAGDDGRYLRVRVTDMLTGRAKVSVNLPLSLVDAGIGIASNFVPGVANADLMNAIRSGMTGKVIDVVDEEDGDHVEIFIE